MTSIPSQSDLETVEAQRDVQPAKFGTRRAHEVLSASLSLFVTIMFLCAMPASAQTGPCQPKGGVVLLGTTSQDGRQVLISSTGAGSFVLKDSGSGQILDQWDQGRGGVHLSLLPIGANAGGVSLSGIGG